MVTKEDYLHVHVRMILSCYARQGGKYALKHSQMTTVSQGNHRQFFGS